jgi:hypothetical protein
MSAWSRFVALWDQREPADALVAVRVGVALVVLADLAQVARLDLVRALWAPIEDGGIGPATHAQPISVVYAFLGASAGSTWVLFSLSCLAALGLLVGAWTRTNALLLALVLAELSRLSPGADRGIDALLRNVLVLLALSGAGATLSVDAWTRGAAWTTDAEVPAWPRYLIVVQVVLVYFWAGVLKQSAAWSSLGDYSALYLILNQPHYSAVALPPSALRVLYPLLQLGTFGTLVFERSVVLVPLLIYLRQTAGQGGWLRALANRARLLEVWLWTGVLFHLGLAATMNLGIFPWGCLALYPALLPSGTVRRWAGRLPAFAR